MLKKILSDMHFTHVLPCKMKTPTAFIPRFLGILANPWHFICPPERDYTGNYRIKNKMSLPRNLSWHWTGSAKNSGEYMQVQMRPDDIAYRTHLREPLNHLAYCMHCMHVMTSVASGDLGRLTHKTFFSKIEQNSNWNPNNDRLWNDILQIFSLIR